jgi:hypothetical protein
MAGFAFTDIADLANSTYETRRKQVLTQVASELQNYPMARRLLKENFHDTGGGDEIKYQLLTEMDSNHRWTTAYSADNIATVNGVIEGTMGWAKGTTGCQFDVDELDLNTPAQRIYNLLQKREFQMNLKRVANLEACAWGGPADGNDTTTPKGLLKYWLDDNASTGFYGANHTNWSGGPGGISCTPAANAGHKHYTFRYVAVSDSDLYTKMVDAIALTGFEAPPDMGPGVESPEPKHVVWTTWDIRKALGDLLEGKNDRVSSLGQFMAGAINVNGVPVNWAAYLQKHHATSDPVIGLDMTQFRVYVPSKDSWHRVTPYERVSGYHTVRRMHIDDKFQLVLERRRSCFLGTKSDPMSD